MDQPIVGLPRQKAKPLFGDDIHRDRIKSDALHGACVQVAINIEFSFLTCKNH